MRKAAGASPSSMYHLFKDFPALVAALLERTFERRFHQVTTHVLTPARLLAPCQKPE